MAGGGALSSSSGAGVPAMHHPTNKPKTKSLLALGTHVSIRREEEGGEEDFVRLGVLSASPLSPTRGRLLGEREL